PPARMSSLTKFRRAFSASCAAFWIAPSSPAYFFVLAAALSKDDERSLANLESSPPASWVTLPASIIPSMTSWRPFTLISKLLLNELSATNALKSFNYEPLAHLTLFYHDKQKPRHRNCNGAVLWLA